MRQQQTGKLVRLVRYPYKGTCSSQNHQRQTREEWVSGLGVNLWDICMGVGGIGWDRKIRDQGNS